jgi:hypothetical protein
MFLQMQNPHVTEDDKQPLLLDQFGSRNAGYLFITEGLFNKMSTLS